MVNQRIKSTLSITVSSHLYQRLKEEIGSRKISGFVEKAISKELGGHDNKLEREQREFEKKLIAGYKRSARSKTLKKESKIWDEIYNDYSVAAPLTSEEEELKNIEPFEVLIERNKENGLDNERSKILVHRLLAIEKEERLITRLGTVDSKNGNKLSVSEVRLLKEMEKVGENPTDNLIICGDSLNALISLSKILEYRKKYVNKVKLIYIDPPFNTGQMFANYDDQLEHSVWLTMMRDRILKAYELLSDDVGQSSTGTKEIQKLFPDIKPFATPKPERLLQRIIQIATNEGDIVLDYFAGSVNTFAVPRLKKVVLGEDKGGIRIICLAENVLNGKLAKLVATQLEYDYQPENEYFCGKKGDVLLAVVEGMLTDGLLNFLLNSKGENKFLEIAALAVDPDLEKSKANEKEEIEKRNFITKHNGSCIKKEIRIEEINEFLNQKLPELRTKKRNFEKFFDEDKNITKIESFFDYDFFRHLINSTYRHFRHQLIGDKYIMRQTLSLSLNKKFKTELTEPSSQIPEYNFFQLIRTTAHEICHCLLGDLFRILGYKIQLLLPLQIKFIEEKIVYVNEKIRHLEVEEEEMETPLIKQELLDRRDKREKIRTIMKYLAELQINCFTKKKVVKWKKKKVKIAKENYSDSKNNYQIEEIIYSYEEKTELSLFQGKENDNSEERGLDVENQEPHSSTGDNIEKGGLETESEPEPEDPEVELEEVPEPNEPEKEEKISEETKDMERDDPVNSNKETYVENNKLYFDNIYKKLELREPNQQAVQAFLNYYYQTKNQNSEKLAESILAVATGVGKTYIMAAILNYLAESEKITNFLIVAPGKIIREKTINNFSLNKPNSLVDKLTIKLPHIIDIKNFHTAKTTDKNQVKLFIFTVQSLTQVRGKTARKTSNYDELLGTSLREHLSKLDDLVILADEHHLYYGEKFSEAIRELKPKILIGLTGTPHKETPPKEIIFRYPLAYALRDELIKKPVIVGRKDSYDNEKTKLEDALLRLNNKQEQLNLYTKIYKLEPRKALMLIIAEDIQHALETETLLKSECNLTEAEIIRVDSSNINETLAQELQTIDDFNNPKKIIIAVGMLKEDNIENLFQRHEFTATENKIETQEIEEELVASQQKGELNEIRKKLTQSIYGNFCVQPILPELETAQQIASLVVKEDNLEIVASNLRLVAYQINKIIQEFAKTKLDKDTEKSI
nr:5792_t:CDS:10 [Entrophospora candida]